MDEPASLNEARDEGGPGPVERALIGAVRLAALPLIASAVILVSLIFGLGLLVRCGSMLVDRLGPPRRLEPSPRRAVEARDF